MTAASEVAFPDVDKKLRILTAMKKVWGNRLTTVFPRQGHYALDPMNIAAHSPANITIEHIAILINYVFYALFPPPQKKSRLYPTGSIMKSTQQGEHAKLGEANDRKYRLLED